MRVHCCVSRLLYRSHAVVLPQRVPLGRTVSRLAGYWLVACPLLLPPLQDDRLVVRVNIQPMLPPGANAADAAAFQALQQDS